MPNPMLTPAKSAGLMTKKEVAARLRVSTRTVDRWRRLWKAAGKDPLGLVQVGRFALLRRRAVEAIESTPGLWL